MIPEKPARKHLFPARDTGADRCLLHTWLNIHRDPERPKRQGSQASAMRERGRWGGGAERAAAPPWLPGLLPGQTAGPGQPGPHGSPFSEAQPSKRVLKAPNSNLMND